MSVVNWKMRNSRFHRFIFLECVIADRVGSALEGLVIQVSEQGTRKVLYQKIVASFPEGWMSSGQISRDGGWFLLYSSLCVR
jgi:hypothetical protein